MDMDALMAQATALQNKVSNAQEKLAKTVIKGIADNGACIVDMTGKYDLLNVKLHPEILLRGSDAVSAVFMAAYRDAKSKADDLIDQIMGEATAGMPIPQ